MRPEAKSGRWEAKSLRQDAKSYNREARSVEPEAKSIRTETKSVRQEGKSCRREARSIGQEPKSGSWEAKSLGMAAGIKKAEATLGGASAFYAMGGAAMLGSRAAGASWLCLGKVDLTYQLVLGAGGAK